MIATGVAQVGTRISLTAAQYGIWIGQQLDPDSPAYWTAEAIELRGDIDLPALEHAVRTALGECVSLHARYHCEGSAVWQTLYPHNAWQLARCDFAGEPDPFAAARAWMEQDLRQRADLEQGPLFATGLLTLGPGQALWYLRTHHIALDGYAYALLAQRVAALYNGTNGALPGPLEPVVVEDQAYQSSSARERDRAFWHEKLAGAPSPAMLAPPGAVARRVRRLAGRVDDLAQWKATATRIGVDWSALIIAAVAAWLQRRTGAHELIIGLPVMGRLGSVALTVPCMAMNIVPLRVAIDPAHGLGELAWRVMAELRALRPHQRYRYEHLRQDLGLVSGARRLFGPVVNLMPFDRPPAFGSLAATSHPVSAGPVEDLSITLVPAGAGLRIGFDANPDTYSDSDLADHLATLVESLRALIAQPLAPLEQVLRRIPAPPVSIVAGEALPPPEPVLDALRRHAARTPLHCAIEHDGAMLNYGALLARTQALAGRLQARGIGQDSRVALLLARGPDAIVAMLAVLWAGAAYVPLDPASPALRIAAVLADVAPALIISGGPYEAGDIPVLVPDDMDASHPAMTAAAGDVAYIIHTSGSTGRPNGVMIGRGALDHFVAGASKRYAMCASDRVLQFAPLHFDASVEEIYLSLCNGATLVLRNDAMLESMPRFLAALDGLNISVLDLPTAFWHELAFSLDGTQQLPASLRLVIIGGEAALAERLARWRAAAPSLTLLNTYGPTEATVICTTAQLAGLARVDGVPIGRPLPGVTIAVVDAALRPVAVGAEGELCLTGGGLAHGYFGRAELSAERFVALPALDGAPRAYRTGDRVRLGTDGQLLYLGRLDDEFKISGYRIDPHEIEAAMLAYPGVSEAAVIGRVSEAGDKHLQAFVVADALDRGALRSFLAERLAAPAVPSHVELLERLPRNANGKIDRGQLRARPADTSAAGATELEQLVMRIWSEVLGVSALRPSDDFFAAGGKSLQAIQVANRLGRALGREVAVSALFRHPTVAALAQSLAIVGHAPPPLVAGAEFAPLLTIQAGHGPALFCIHPAEGLAWCYMGLARSLPHTPLYGLQARGMTDDAPLTIDAMVDDYVRLLLQVQPQGPYRLLGWSCGGGVAHAMALRLQEQGHAVTLLAMMDAYPSDIWQGVAAPEERDALVAMLDVIGASADGDNAALLDKFGQQGSALAHVDRAMVERISRTALHTMNTYRELRHGVFAGDLLYFHATQRRHDAPDWRLWQQYVGGAIDCIGIDSNHNTMSQAAPLGHIGRVLAARLHAEDTHNERE